jgi:hypothetical protein
MVAVMTEVNETLAELSLFEVTTASQPLRPWHPA